MIEALGSCYMEAYAELVAELIFYLFFTGGK